MESTHQLLITLGGILLLGLLTSTLGHRTFLPRVTLLLIFGVLIGHDGFDIIPGMFDEWFEILSSMALVMVGFLLGGQLTVVSLRQSAGQVMWISITTALVVAVLVCVGLVLAGLSLPLAILLGCIASATAPAAVLDVVAEDGRQTHFGDLLLAIVALDDVWSLALFSAGVAIVTSLNGGGGDASFLATAGREILGACALGVVLGVPAAYLTGRTRSGEPLLTEALGIVFLCGGLAIWLEVSYLIAAMVMGAVIANFARHHEYPFHAIEGIEQPFMVIFFVLAGATLELDSLRALGLVGVVYILCRFAGKVIGAKLGSLASHSDRRIGNWMGIALLPQAGVPIGMALVASHQFPEYRQILLSLVISSTVIFDIVGPVFTRMALHRVAPKESSP